MRNYRPFTLTLLMLAGCDSAAASVDAAVADATTDAGQVQVRTDPTLPAATGDCPSFEAAGEVTVSPEGIAPRSAAIWVGEEAAATDGPLVFFWHGTGGAPSEATFALGETVIDAIVAAGGVVIAPAHDPEAGTFPWFMTTGGARPDDLLVADELLACAEATIGIDDHRIHSIGFSAGALHTSQMSFRRASYVASVVTYSGGLLSPRPPPSDAPDARFAAMALFGGASDEVIVSFAETSDNYMAAIEARGHFGFLCDHGMGHTVPAEARESAWQFLSDHPYGETTTYAEELPDGFYAPCALTP